MMIYHHEIRLILDPENGKSYSTRWCLSHRFEKYDVSSLAFGVINTVNMFDTTTCSMKRPLVFSHQEYQRKPSCEYDGWWLCHSWDDLPVEKTGFPSVSGSG